MREEVYTYLGIAKDATISEGVQAMIRDAWKSIAQTAIVTAQDILGLGNEARMNFPSTIGENWRWRLKPGQLGNEELKWLRQCTKMYGRF